ncbi:GNAT family N-acetyltransferase [Heyndrickxia oleronia]|uniref:GNAT family N-acetyltransferase n=1 Tax=Heyndrickxia oleronia TaxID=38875 RepID=UPI002040F1B7|nr:GNAT family N-acetyltransferase [Heyndrickxia oleronia]MCM3454323.1 GNAT family N-acetyltransferase [Heyndrickxia oleronia]
MIGAINLNITKLQPSQFRDALQLSEYAFQFQISEEEVKKKIESYMDHDIYGMYEDEILAAKIHIRPFQIWLNGQKIRMGGIANVATYPEYRRNGYIRELLTHSLAEMKKKGQLVSYLHPFSIGFYRKFGWETFSNYIKIHFSKADLIKQNEVPGYIKRFTKTNYTRDVEKIYDEYAQRFIGMFARDENRWKDTIINDRNIAIYYNLDHEPLGYILYQVANSRMEIREFVTIQHAARVGLWNFICQHDSMVTEIEMNTYETDPFLFTLANPDMKVHRLTYGMARIIDVQEFLNVYPFQPANHESVSFQIIDENAPWNTGTYTLSNQSTISYSPHIEQQEMSCSCLTINHFTALLFRYKSAQELVDIGAIKGNKEEILKLEELLPKIKPNLMDFF